jgi:ribosomal protein S18 acetylase RimI-like enzyme
VSEELEDVTVRPAESGDRDAVLAFTAHTFPDGDYIAAVFDTWLEDTSGALLVAIFEGRPVGLAHLLMLSAEDAWIEGIRVDPAVRRRGIGRVLISQVLRTAYERGAKVARLFTDSDNVASQTLVTRRFGFQRVAEVTRYSSEALEIGSSTDTSALLETQAATPGPRLLLAGGEDYARIWSWLEQSNLAPVNGGLQFGSWCAWALTGEDLQAYLLDGAVWLLEEWETIQAIAILQDEVISGEDEPGTLQVRYIDGAASSMGTLALHLREIAQMRGLAQVELWLPNLLILRDAMSGAGYNRLGDDDVTMLVYQRSL